MSACIALGGVSVAYGRRRVLENLSLDLDLGGVTVLLGPNGSGKTTLLRLLLGLLRPAAGEIRLRGKELRTIRRSELAGELAYVPQAHREAFAYRVADVVLMGRIAQRRVFGGYAASDQRLVDEALAELAIGHLADRPYTEVSGGERQLTLIARAMVQGARTLVMDEPASSLDYGNQVRLLARIARLAGLGLGFICSSHNPDHALTIADRVILLREGKVIGDGPPRDVVTNESLSDLYGIDVASFAPRSLVQSGKNGTSDLLQPSAKQANPCDS